MSIRKTFSGNFKGKVAIEAVKEERTLAELSSQYEIHANQIRNWKTQLIQRAGELFEDNRKKNDKDKDALIEELYKQVGQLKVELDWLKKKSGLLGFS